MTKRAINQFTGLAFATLTITGASLAVIPNSAIAAEIPTEFRGSWCSQSQHIEDSFYAYTIENLGCEGNIFVISANSVIKGDRSIVCVIREATKFDVCPWGMIFKDRAQAQVKRPGQINPWSPGYHLVFECSGSRMRPENVTVDWAIEKGGITGNLPQQYRCPWDRK